MSKLFLDGKEPLPTDFGGPELEGEGSTRLEPPISDVATHLPGGVYRLGVYSRKSRVWESTGLEPPNADLEPHMPVLKKRYFGPFTSFFVVHGKMFIPLLKLTLHIALTEIVSYFFEKSHVGVAVCVE